MSFVLVVLWYKGWSTAYRYPPFILFTHLLSKYSTGHSFLLYHELGKQVFNNAKEPINPSVEVGTLGKISHTSCLLSVYVSFKSITDQWGLYHPSMFKLVDVM